jgi:ABC-type transport system involved in multi-copper enzyme maturation permease subunit
VVRELLKKEWSACPLRRWGWRYAAFVPAGIGTGIVAAAVASRSGATLIFAAVLAELAAAGVLAAVCGAMAYPKEVAGGTLELLRAAPIDPRRVMAAKFAVLLVSLWSGLLLFDGSATATIALVAARLEPADKAHEHIWFLVACGLYSLALSALILNIALVIGRRAGRAAKSIPASVAVAALLVLMGALEPFFTLFPAAGRPTTSWEEADTKCLTWAALTLGASLLPLLIPPGLRLPGERKGDDGHAEG